MKKILLLALITTFLASVSFASAQSTDNCIMIANGHSNLVKRLVDTKPYVSYELTQLNPCTGNMEISNVTTSWDKSIFASISTFSNGDVVGRLNLRGEEYAICSDGRAHVKMSITSAATAYLCNTI